MKTLLVLVGILSLPHAAFAGKACPAVSKLSLWIEGPDMAHHLLELGLTCEDKVYDEDEHASAVLTVSKTGGIFGSFENLAQTVDLDVDDISGRTSVRTSLTFAPEKYDGDHYYILNLYWDERRPGDPLYGRKLGYIRAAYGIMQKNSDGAFAPVRGKMKIPLRIDGPASTMVFNGAEVGLTP